MVTSLASRKSLSENRLTLIRRWFGACESACCLRYRILKDSKGGEHRTIYVALQSSLHQEIDFIGDDWKDLFLMKNFRFGFVMSDETVIECRPIWATKHSSHMEIICLIMDEEISQDFTDPRSMLMADNKYIFHRIPASALYQEEVTDGSISASARS